MRRLILLIAVSFICCCTASGPYGRWLAKEQIPPRPDGTDFMKAYDRNIDIKTDVKLDIFHIETTIWRRGVVYSMNKSRATLYENIQSEDLAFVLKHVADVYPNAQYSVVFPEDVRDDHGKAKVLSTIKGAGIVKCQVVIRHTEEL